jgi:cytochrome c-type biogenesis protein CcmH
VTSRPSNKRWALGAGIAIVIVVVLVAIFRPQHESAASRANRLEEHVACPICAGEDIAHSNSEQAIAMRADIERRIKSGESDDEIVGYYARRYPDKQLNPDDSGLGLVVWGLPVVVVILAVAGLGFAIARWKREPRMVATEADEALVTRARRPVTDA